MKAAEWDQFMESLDSFEERKLLPTPVVNNMRYQIDRSNGIRRYFSLSPVAYKRLCWEINNQLSPLSYTEVPRDITSFEGVEIRVADDPDPLDILLVTEVHYRGKLPERWKEGFEEARDNGAGA